jgi:hypothetical protein
VLPSLAVGAGRASKGDSGSGMPVLILGQQARTRKTTEAFLSKGVRSRNKGDLLVVPLPPFQLP